MRKPSDHTIYHPTKGNWFVYLDGPDQIQIWSSNWTGKEEVYINGKLVSKLRSLRKKTEHNFKSQSGNDYHILFITGFNKKQVKCIISKNGQEVRQFIIKSNPEKKKLLTNYFIIYFVLTVGMLFLAEKLEKELLYYGVIALAATFLISVATMKNRYLIEEYEK